MVRISSPQMARKRHRMQQKSKPPVGVFIAATIVIFFMTLSAADSIGFVPDYIDGSTPLTTSGSSPVVTSGSDTSADDTIALAALPQLGPLTDSAQAPTKPPVVSVVEPTHITISSVGIDLPVQDPVTTNVDALDALLVNGPAHYSASAGLGVQGTMIIFAHSSHLPIVHNKMFQAFNQIPNVQQGDIIDITGSDGKDYLYSAQSVAKASIDTGTSIDISPSQGTRLVLVTCDTLTGKSARYVLTADFIGTD